MNLLDLCCYKVRCYKCVIYQPTLVSSNYCPTPSALDFKSFYNEWFS